MRRIAETIGTASISTRGIQWTYHASWRRCHLLRCSQFLAFGEGDVDLSSANALVSLVRQESVVYDMPLSRSCRCMRIFSERRNGCVKHRSMLVHSF